MDADARVKKGIARFNPQTDRAVTASPFLCLQFDFPNLAPRRIIAPRFSGKQISYANKNYDTR